jgi:hypothetical protein
MKDRSSITDALKFINDSTGSLAEYLAIFETASFDKARPEVALPLELLVKERIPGAGEHEFVFHATYEFNFYYRDFYRELTTYLFFLDDEDETLFFDGLPKHVALIALPVIERDNIFSLVILLHELAHYYDRTQAPPLSQLDVQEVLTPEIFEDWVTEAKSIAYVPEPFKGESGIPAEVSDFFTRLSLVNRVGAAGTWLRELTADIVASRLGGVAFYLTAKKFLDLFPMRPGGQYPPNYRRFHAIAEVLIDPTNGIERDLDVGALCIDDPGFGPTITRVVAELRRDYKVGDITRSWQEKSRSPMRPRLKRRPTLHTGRSRLSKW